MDYHQYSGFTNPPCSYWLTTTKETDYPSLSDDTSADVAIIGGGMAGILSSFFLCNEGCDVVLLEAGRIAGRTTAHTTAKITSQHGLIYHKIKKQLGLELAKQYASANETAIRQIQKIVEENHIHCDFTPQSAYIYTNEEKNVRKMEDELKIVSKLGIQASSIHEIPFPISIKAGIRFDGQAQFHPRKFLLPLADTIYEKGVRIFEKNRVIDMEKSQYGYIVTTEQNKKVTAKNIILASHYPFFQKKGMYYSRLYCERSYLLAVKTKETYPGGMYINAENPSRSLRGISNKTDEWVLVGGEKHKTGQGSDLEQHYQALASFAQDIFTVEDIPFRWSAQDCMTLDGIPYVGNITADTPNLFVATGFEKWGMTNSMASAMILSDLIVRGESPWQEVYSPSRKNIAGSAKNFIVENFDVAKQLIAGKVSPITDEIELDRGKGKVIETQSGRTGAYRDEKGCLHLVNTTCTHLGCELNWNSAEKSWDCPCHGSRFTYEGSIIEGPAVKPLTGESDTPVLKKGINDQF